MRNLLALLLLYITAYATEAQTNFAFEDVYTHVDTTRNEGDLLLRITDVNFLKNNEYFNHHVEGYTLIGYRIAPSLVYYIRNNVLLEAGADIVQYGGTDKYDHIYPKASVHWQINRTWHMSMGSLNGHMAHQLPESVWEPERQLVDEPEIGLQISANHNIINAEAWLNWQQFIKKNDTIPEKLTVGLRMDVTPTPKDANLHIAIPMSMIISHIGGQISNYPDKMQSLTNGSLALRIGRQWHNHFIQKLYLDLEGQFYHAMVDRNVRPFSDGAALYPKIILESKTLDAHIGLWSAHDYFSLYGNPIFTSLSNYNNSVYTRRRQLLTFGVDFNYALTQNIRFSIGGKGYYDTPMNHMDYSYQAHLVVTPQWKLTNIKTINSNRE